MRVTPKNESEHPGKNRLMYFNFIADEQASEP